MASFKVEIWETKKRRSSLLTVDIKNCFELTMGNLLRSGIQTAKKLRENALSLMSTIQELAEMCIISVSLQSGWKR